MDSLESAAHTEFPSLTFFKSFIWSTIIETHLFIFLVIDFEIQSSLYLLLIQKGPVFWNL